MPTVDDISKVSNSAAAIAVLCLIALGFVAWMVLKWSGRMIETKLLPLGESAVEAIKGFLTEMKQSQIKIVESQGTTSSSLRRVEDTLTKQNALLQQIAEAVHRIAESSKQAEEEAAKNSQFLQTIAEKIEAACKFQPPPCVSQPSATDPNTGHRGSKR